MRASVSSAEDGVVHAQDFVIWGKNLTIASY